MGMVTKAMELAKTNGWFLTRQFENEANADMHYRTTAPEIIDDFAGERLDLSGDWIWHRRHAEGRRARFARSVPRPRSSCANRKTLRCSAADRAGAQSRWLLPAAANPAFKPHRCRAGRRDFIPKLTEDAVRTGSHQPHHSDRKSGRAALQPRSGAKEGIFVGITAGGPVAGALHVCAEAPNGSTVLACCPIPASAT